MKNKINNNKNAAVQFLSLMMLSCLLKAKKKFLHLEDIIYINIVRSAANAEMMRHARCWTHCSRQSAKLHSFPYPLVFLGRIQDHRILWYGSADQTVVPISAFCCTTWSQSNNLTDRWTDKWHARSINVTG